MKKHPRLWLALGALLAFALLAAACGDDDDEPEAAPATTAAPTTAAAADDDMADEMDLAGTVVEILGPETGPEAEGFLEAFAPFEERTGIDVQYGHTRCHHRAEPCS